MTVRANTDGTTDARSAHVPPAASHARADEWVVHTDSCRLQWSYPLVLDCECGGPLAYSPEAHDAISAELVACTLGQRRHADRTELRVDMLGKVLHALQVIKRARWRLA